MKMRSLLGSSLRVQLSCTLYFWDIMELKFSDLLFSLILLFFAVCVPAKNYNFQIEILQCLSSYIYVYHLEFSLAQNFAR